MSDQAKMMMERAAMLRSLDPEQAKTFYREHHPGGAMPSDEVVLVGMHKARVQAQDLTEQERQMSRAWLSQRGFTWLDPDGPTIDSTSDERTVNNVMRHEYRVLTDEEKLWMRRLKDAGLFFVEMCDEIGDSRELSLAKTRMEEAVMWAVKHVTR